MQGDMKSNNGAIGLGINYYDTVAHEYLNHIGSKYHLHRLETTLSLIKNIDLQGKVCIDFGCGDGVVCEILARRGAHVIGIDPSEIMIDAARSRLKGYDNIDIVQGYADDLLGYHAHDVALITCLNTLAYLTQEEEYAFYEAARRKLKKNGHLLVTHSNELFDMFTMNKFTVAFYEKNFKTSEFKCGVGDLLRNPNVPERVLFNIRENPLSYKYKLKRFGLNEIRQEYCMLHNIPPLLMKSFDADDIDNREYPDTLCVPIEERWKLMFQCSIFCSLSMRTDE